MKLAGDILAEPHALQARTLGGAWVALRKKQITLARDPGRIAAQPQRIKTEQIWDGRFLFRDRQTEKYTANMARNLKNTPELTKISAMARETYPMIDADETEILCLNRWRLNQVAFMFDYDNLINQSVKKGDGLSLRKD
jgi:hypothetical protein